MANSRKSSKKKPQKVFVRPLQKVRQYEIEKILNHRLTYQGSVQYLASWKGYPMTDITWVDECDLGNYLPKGMAMKKLVRECQNEHNKAQLIRQFSTMEEYLGYAKANNIDIDIEKIGNYEKQEATIQAKIASRKKKDLPRTSST